MKLRLIPCFLLLTLSSVSFAENSMEKNSKKMGESLAFLMAVDQSEIDAANEALKKSTNDQVKAFAQLMIKDHTQNLRETEQLSNELKATPVENAKIKMLKEDADKELKSLSQLNGNDFDKTYINDMVKDHKNALAALNKLSSQVKEPSLAKHLTATKMHVTEHLAKAKQIQQDMK